MRAHEQRTTSYAIAMTGFLCLSTCSPSAGGKDLVFITVCDLIAHAEQYQGKRMKVRASVESDGIERTVLIDRTCPDRGLALDLSDGIENHVNVVALQRAIFDGQPGTTGKEISGLFWGTFEWRPNEIPKWVLHASAVSEIQSRTVPQ